VLNSDRLNQFQTSRTKSNFDGSRVNNSFRVNTRAYMIYAGFPFGVCELIFDTFLCMYIYASASHTYVVVAKFNQLKELARINCLFSSRWRALPNKSVLTFAILIRSRGIILLCVHRAGKQNHETLFMFCVPWLNRRLLFFSLCFSLPRCISKRCEMNLLRMLASVNIAHLMKKSEI
jgi:hypothetical protein